LEETLKRNTIAIELEFSNLKHFCTLFKKSTGLTISAFKDAHK